MSNTNLYEKVRGVYNYIQDEKFYVNSALDVSFGDVEAIEMDKAGKSVLYVPLGEAYNSVLLYTTLVGLTKNGTLLFQGPPGCGKTTSAEYVGHFLHDIPMNEILESEIQGHPEQTEEKMVARFDLSKLINGEEFVVPRKFFGSPIKIVDEINRLPPGKISMLMRVLDISKATYGNVELETIPGPLYATANFADAGNFAMTPPALDRFDLSVMVAEPFPLDADTILERGDEKLTGLGREVDEKTRKRVMKSLEERMNLPSKFKLKDGDLDKIRTQIDNIEIDQEAKNFRHYFLFQMTFCDAGAKHDINRKTGGNAWAKKPTGVCHDCHYKSTESNPCQYTSSGVSMRAQFTVDRYARALAWFRGNDKATEEDIKAVLPFAMSHRIVPTNAVGQDGMDQTFFNDRVGLVRELQRMSERGYKEAATEMFQIYGAACTVYHKKFLDDKEMNFKDTRDSLRNAMQELGSKDDPIKFALSQSLAQKYNELHIKHKPADFKEEKEEKKEAIPEDADKN